MKNTPKDRFSPQEWLILGTFPDSNPRTRMSHDFIPALENTFPREGDKVFGIPWKRLQLTENKTINLRDFFTNRRDDAVCYAHIYIYSPTEQKIALHIGCDDGSVVWLNGKKIHILDRICPWNIQQNPIQATLQAGWNRLLIKLTQSISAWPFTMVFTGVDGALLSGIQTSLNYPLPINPPQLPETFPVQILDFNWIGFPFSYPESQEMVQYQARIVNLSPNPIQHLQYQFFINDEPEGPVFTIEDFPGTSEKELLWVIPLSRALSLAMDENAQVLLKRIPDGETFNIKKSPELLKDLLLVGIAPTTLKTWEYHEGDFQSEEDARRSDENWIEVNPGDTLPNSVGWLRRQIIISLRRISLPTNLNLEVMNAKTQLFLDGKKLDTLENISLTQGSRPSRQFSAVLRIEPTGNSSPIFSRASLHLAINSIDYLLRNLKTATEFFERQLPDLDDLVKPALIALSRRDHRSLRPVLTSLCKPLQEISRKAKRHTAHMIGQSHIDLAWMAPMESSVEDCRTSFQEALQLIRENPHFIFNQSQAAAYDAMQRYEPEIFHGVQEAVPTGRWVVIGGTWTEPMGNIPCGESFVRQCLYGQLYFKNQLGVLAKVSWLQDPFGYSNTLPQILKKSGMDYLYCRGRGHYLFVWEGIDGTRILCKHSQVDADPTVTEDLDFVDEEYGVRDIMSVYGFIGPSPYTVRRIDSMKGTDVLPDIRHSSPDAFFNKVSPLQGNFPVIQGEITFTYDGCYTSQARAKQNNRRSENLLIQTETFCALATRIGNPYPREVLYDLWKTVLLFQSHDILAGTTIHEVYENCDEKYASCIKRCNDLMTQSIRAISQNADTRGDGIPIVVFNSLSWERDDLVKTRIHLQNKPGNLIATDGQTQVPVQIINMEQTPEGWITDILFIARRIPSVGFKCFWIKPGSVRKNSSLLGSQNYIESDEYRLELDPVKGCVSNLYDKKLHRHMLNRQEPQMNMELLGDDSNHSAWEIRYTDENFQLDKAESVELIESGPVRAILRVKYSFGSSRFEQLFILYQGFHRVDIQCRINWHERRKMLKARIPVSVLADSAVFETPYGVIQRPNTDQEVTMQKWMDISDGKYGIGILNDSKYGCDIQKEIVRLSLLRSPYFPDPQADEGTHEFTYSLVSHKGNWQKGNVDRYGAGLNSPLQAIEETPHEGNLGKEHSFLSFEQPNLVLGALKQAEDSEDLIARVVERQGQGKKQVQMNLDFTPQEAFSQNLLEMGETPLEIHENAVDFPIKRWEILTLRIK